MMDKTFFVRSFSRPALHFQELKQPDGTSKPGVSFWSAVEFVLDGAPELIVGYYPMLTIGWSANPSEKWVYTNATVMVFPDSKPDLGRYVVTFNSVKRVT